MKTTIEIRLYEMGRDAVFLVTGGIAHIGAVATAYVSKDDSVQVNVMELPGHREGELAAELARKACEVLQRSGCGCGRHTY